ncbi:histidine kinase dimerization/phospho-acceptor domain-containing protein, partial [Pseudomonas aeruginosa]
RHSLGDLAHSLKTPLAVLQGVGDQLAEEPGNREQVRVLQGQIERMSQQIGYQLQRASLRKSGLVRHREQLAPLQAYPLVAIDRLHQRRQLLAMAYQAALAQAGALQLIAYLLAHALDLTASGVF